MLIGQTFVYGDSLQSALVAIVVPDEEPLRAMLESSETGASLAKAPLPEICKSSFVKEKIMSEIKIQGKENGLQAQKKYERQIEAMYASMPKPRSKI